MLNELKPVFLKSAFWGCLFFAALFSGCRQNSAAIFWNENEAASALSLTETARPAAKNPKNIILMIGDGMALAHATALIYGQNNRSVLEQFPVVGFHKSYSTSDLVTDSAAGATAFACGEKTYNSAIGLNRDTLPCETILENLKKRGFAVGITVTCSASHATPAAFISHQKLRTYYYEIAADYAKQDFDCLVAGGGHYFTDRDDKRNLLRELIKRGFSVDAGHNLRRAPWEKNDRPIIFITDDYEPESALNDRRYLPEAVKLATNFLKRRSEKGFFLLVEGSQIDWACHANDGDWMMSELKDFEKTMVAALEFARLDGETLIIVTGDHDGGGVSIERGSRMGYPEFKWASKDHGGVMVPVYAFGPGAEKFSGIYENTAIHSKMMELLK